MSFVDTVGTSTSETVNASDTWDLGRVVHQDLVIFVFKVFGA